MNNQRDWSVKDPNSQNNVNAAWTNGEELSDQGWGNLVSGVSKEPKSNQSKNISLAMLESLKQ